MPVYINKGSIIAKTVSKVKSAEYQAAMRHEIRQARKTGNTSNLNVDIITEAKMAAAAKIMEDLLSGVAARAGVPGSILANISEITQSGISYNSDDTEAYITLSFTGDASRPSLSSLYSGAYDIITLFDQGWHAGGSVYGTWNGQRIASRSDFGGLNFLQEAISEFNATYGAMYHCTASMN